MDEIKQEEAIPARAAHPSSTRVIPRDVLPFSSRSVSPDSEDNDYEDETAESESLASDSPSDSQSDLPSDSEPSDSPSDTESTASGFVPDAVQDAVPAFPATFEDRFAFWKVIRDQRREEAEAATSSSSMPETDAEDENASLAGDEDASLAEERETAVPAVAPEESPAPSKHSSPQYPTPVELKRSDDSSCYRPAEPEEEKESQCAARRAQDGQAPFEKLQTRSAVPAPRTDAVPSQIEQCFLQTLQNALLAAEQSSNTGVHPGTASVVPAATAQGIRFGTLHIGTFHAGSVGRTVTFSLGEGHPRLAEGRSSHPAEQRQRAVSSSGGEVMSEKRRGKQPMRGPQD
ncbi:hypothetical protein DFH11DRAFT_1732195 [Phellopilus nigrolimitatus]|nr:hypothetical protein DFH11DRAFT_1732195 [Phellopilus nigrolimitatus]